MSFDRLVAIGGEMKKSPSVWALCRGNKRPLPSLHREYRFLDDQTAFSLTGFFAPIVAASDATDKVPTWASCTGYIGWLGSPLTARLANLVKV
jgi:hypothetical protein